MLDILKFPDPGLKKTSKTIDHIDDSLRRLAQDMIDIMYKEPGIGLAAPQVGEPVRMFVIDTEWTKSGGKRNPKVVINPQITEHSGSFISREGCLSVPNYNADVKRYAHISFTFTDLEGKVATEEAEGLRAACIQHEIDHLDGILFIDHISRLKRSMYVKKRKKQMSSYVFNLGKKIRT